MQRHLDRFPQVLRFQMTVRRRVTQPRAISHHDVNLEYSKKVSLRGDSFDTQSTTFLLSKSTPRHINSLPELCLLNIFNSLPLNDVARIGSVCSLWHYHQASVCARKRSLKLVIVSDRKLKTQNNSTLLLKSCTFAVTVKLICCFPNITSLSIQVEGVGMRSSGDLAIESLIASSWCTNLVKLSLSNTYLGGHSAAAIVEAINKYPFLRSLSLMDAFSVDFKCTFPIVAQLEHFECDMEIDPDFLKQFAQGNEALRQISIQMPDHSANTIDSFLELEPKFASKFVRLLNDQYYPLEGSHFDRICPHFTHLQKIEVFIMFEFIKCLSNLSTLKHLHTLRLTLDPLEPWTGASRQFSIAPLESVARLRVIFYLDADSALKVMHFINFVHLFPNIKYAELDACYEHEETVHLFQDQPRLAATHYQAMMEPLKKCCQLLELECVGLNYTNKWTRKDTI